MDETERWSCSRLWLLLATVFLKITVSGPSRSIRCKATRDQAELRCPKEGTRGRLRPIDTSDS